MKKRHGPLAVRKVPTMHFMALVVVFFVLTISGTAYGADTADNKQQAAQIALQKNGNAGKVLGVTTEVDDSGQKTFAVKIINDGRVRIVRIAQSP